MPIWPLSGRAPASSSCRRRSTCRCRYRAGRCRACWPPRADVDHVRVRGRDGDRPSRATAARRRSASIRGHRSRLPDATLRRRAVDGQGRPRRRRPGRPAHRSPGRSGDRTARRRRCPACAPSREPAVPRASARGLRADPCARPARRGEPSTEDARQNATATGLRLERITRPPCPRTRRQKPSLDAGKDGRVRQDGRGG